MRRSRYQAVIIGGGIIGASVAYYLARLGQKVLLVEKTDLASGTSGACDKARFIQSKLPGLHLQMALASSRMYRQLAAEINQDFGLRQAGGMILISSEAEMEAMIRIVEEQRETGLDVKLLSGEKARELEPALSPHLLGATFSPEDGEVDPIRLTLALSRAARARGADIWLRSEVTGILVKNRSVKGVIVRREGHESEVAAEVVVNAAGVWAPEIGRMVGLDIPIVPRRGQILVTEPMPRTVSHVMLCARYIASKYSPKAIEQATDDEQRLGIGLSLGQTDSGNLLVGGCREFVGFDRSTTQTALRAIARHACRLVPALRSIKVIRAYAGLRPYTPDGLPIIGPVEQLRGFIMAAGHEGDGIMLAPITGQLVAELVTRGHTRLPLAPLSLSRFPKATG